MRKRSLRRQRQCKIFQASSKNIQMTSNLVKDLVQDSSGTVDDYSFEDFRLTSYKRKAYKAANQSPKECK